MIFELASFNAGKQPWLNGLHAEGQIRINCM